MRTAVMRTMYWLGQSQLAAVGFRMVAGPGAQRVFALLNDLHLLTEQHFGEVKPVVSLFAQTITRMGAGLAAQKVSFFPHLSAFSISSQHFGEVKPVVARTLQELDMVSNKVFSVEASEDLLTALETMHTHGMVKSVVGMPNSHMKSLSFMVYC